MECRRLGERAGDIWTEEEFRPLFWSGTRPGSASCSVRKGGALEDRPTWG